MDTCQPASTPIYPKTCLVCTPYADPVFDQNLYQGLIGSRRNCVTCTRPDLAFAMSCYSRFSSHPLERHHTAVKICFGYLARTRSRSLKYKLSGTSVPLSIVGFSDSDYTCCRNTCRSVAGYAFMLHGCAIS